MDAVTKDALIEDLVRISAIAGCTWLQAITLIQELASLRSWTMLRASALVVEYVEENQQLPVSAIAVERWHAERIAKINSSKKEVSMITPKELEKIRTELVENFIQDALDVYNQSLKTQVPCSTGFYQVEHSSRSKFSAQEAQQIRIALRRLLEDAGWDCEDGDWDCEQPNSVFSYMLKPA